MTLTNQATILRQIGANGGSGWGLPDDDRVSEEEVAASMHGKRVLKALEKYREAIVKIGRPATVHEISQVTKSTVASVGHFTRTHPEWFNRIEVMRDWKKTYLIELRTN